MQTGTETIAFPLNVYARVLERQAGRVDYLHFGVFEPGATSVLEAQERASRLLWDHLPASPCKLLEVGIGLGTTLARLTRSGYAAHGIGPDAHQLKMARARHGADLPVTQSRLEDFVEQPGQWQALLFQESSQYIPAPALFEAADRLLAPGRQTVLVMDEFALESSPGETLHSLAVFKRCAVQHGWTLDVELDLTQQARPTVDYLLSEITAQHLSLQGDLSVSAGALDELLTALRRYEAAYASGRYGYRLLRLVREGATAPPDELMQVLPHHFCEVQKLFAAVFGHQMSGALHEWKYGHGRGQAMAMSREDEMLVHVGGLRRELAYLGRRELGCQVCDVMSARQAQDSLALGRGLRRVTAAFLEKHIGVDRQHLVGYGFPNRRAFEVAQRQGLYAEADRIVSARWRARPWPGRFRLRVTSLSRDDLRARSKKIDQLWAKMAADLRDRVLGVRDTAWFDHRYAQHPEVHYELLWVQPGFGWAPLGLIVLRRHADHVDLMDLVAPVKNLPLLVGVARDWAAEQGLPFLQAWFTASQQALFLVGEVAQPELSDPAITIPANVHTPGPVDELKDRWFLMLGDADFT